MYTSNNIYRFCRTYLYIIQCLKYTCKYNHIILYMILYIFRFRCDIRRNLARSSQIQLSSHACFWLRRCCLALKPQLSNTPFFCRSGWGILVQAWLHMRIHNVMQHQKPCTLSESDKNQDSLETAKKRVGRFGKWELTKVAI